MRAVLVAARTAIARRRLQSVIVGFVVLLSAATAVLATGLLVMSHGPFDQSFAAAHGAHMATTIRADIPAQQIADTAHATGVEAAAGPFDQATVAISGIGPAGDIVVVGRSEQLGSVDQLSLDSGGWLTGPGQIVLTRRFAGPMLSIGSTMTVKDGPTLTVVGIANSVTGTADAWVWPTQTDVLHRDGAERQMLYRFTSNATDAALTAALSAATAGLPDGAVTSATSYLSIRSSVNRSISAFAPFVVAFAILGIILSVLITTNVVNGAVVSGFRSIGIMKTLGFTPAQVVGVYVLQVLGPALIGCAVGVPLGVVMALPLLQDTDRAYDLPSREIGVPAWVLVTVAIAAPLLVMLAAVGPATRAGRLAANQAISVGRAPRTGRGFRARRALAASPLPRPVALGLGMPLARPSRMVGTVVALLLGCVTLVFATGLATSLARIHTAFTRSDAIPVTASVMLAHGGGPRPVQRDGETMSIPDPAQVQSTIAATAGTSRTVFASRGIVRAAGVRDEIEVTGYAGDAGWVGYRMINGRWYANPAEVVAPSYFLRQTGHHVGDQLTLTGGHTVTITGEVLDNGDDLTLIGDASLIAEPLMMQLEIGLTPGTDPAAYVETLDKTFPDSSGVHLEDNTSNAGEQTFLVLNTLIATLTLLLSSVAALGVLNTVVLNTRERIFEIGVLKSLGMTPRQIRIMVVTSMIGLGVVAGVVAVPLGVLLQHRVLPIMGNAAGTGLPPSIIDVYRPGTLILLGCAGVVLAVIGALVPAGWAARTRVATALRAE